MTSPSLTKQVSAGVRVTFLTTLLSAVAQAGILVILARLIGPKDYGLFAAAVTIGALTTWLAASLVERVLIVTISPGDLDGRILPVVALATLCAVATWGGTSLLVWLGVLDLPPWVVAFQGLNLVVASVAIIPRVHLRRSMAYGYISLGGVGGLILGNGLTSIALASAGHAGTALFAGTLVQFLVLSSVLVAVTPKRLLWPVRTGSMAQTARDMVKLGGSASLEVVYGRMPMAVIGAILGPVALGLFNRAYTLVQIPLEMLTNSISRVLLSAFATVQGEQARVRRGMQQLVTGSCLIICPVAAGVAGSHVQLVTVILGDDWLPSAAIIPFLTLATAAVMLAHLFGVLTEASRWIKEKTRLHATMSAVLFCLLLAGSRFGLEGAASGLAIAALINLHLFMRIGARILDLRYRTIARWMMPGFGGALLTGSYAAAIAHFVHLSMIAELCLQIAGCGMIFGALIAIQYREQISDRLSVRRARQT